MIKPLMSQDGDGLHRIPRRDPVPEGSESSVVVYDLRGRPSQDSRDAAARKTAFANGIVVYEIRFGSIFGTSKPMDPYGLDFNETQFVRHRTDESKRIFRFKEVSEDLFKIYLDYLQNPGFKHLYSLLQRKLSHG